VLAIWVVVTAGDSAAGEKPKVPVTGTRVPELASFDRLMIDLLRKWEVPGGAVAVAKDGRLVFSRGYGLADVQRKRPVQPDALFRIASVSKPITAAAVLVLVEKDRLDLDAKAIDLLGDVNLPEGKTVDPAVREITVRQLLHHTAGFDRGKSFDPMLRPTPVVEAIGTTPEMAAIIRFMLPRPLDFEPGTQYAYSNFGYCLLGRIIEQVTGKPYDDAVNQLVLYPAGIRRMKLARTRRADRADGEVCYYPPPGSKPVESVFSDDKKPVPTPYGRFYIDAMDAHGGWLASASDLVRFATHVDGSRSPGLLKPATLRLLQSRPAPPVSVDADAYYGLGWMVRPVGDSANWWHAGSLPGTRSLLVRTHHGMVWAAVFNGSPRNGNAFAAELDRGLWRAFDQVKSWPEHDLFGGK